MLKVHSKNIYDAETLTRDVSINTSRRRMILKLHASVLHIAQDERKRVRTLRKTGTPKGLMEGSVPRAEVGVEGGNNAMETSPAPDSERSRNT